MGETPFAKGSGSVRRLGTQERTPVKDTGQIQGNGLERVP